MCKIYDNPAPNRSAEQGTWIEDIGVLPHFHRKEEILKNSKPQGLNPTQICDRELK